MSDQEPEDRQQEVLHAVLKFVGVTVAIGIFIWIATSIVVGQLDLNADEGPIGSQEPTPSFAPLPTTAITETPSATPTETPTEEPTDLPTLVESEPPTSPTPSGSTDIELSASPVFVGPMQRINLEGDWPGHDGDSLAVQRFEEGEWVDFGIHVQVRVGGFKTYVQTSHEGKNIFRVFDENSGAVSNEVTVTIGS